MRARAAALALGLSALAASAGAEEPATLVTGFEQVCGGGPAALERIAAAAAAHGWKPVADADLPAPRAGFVRAGAWSKPDGRRGHMFLVVGHGDSPLLSPGVNADTCQVSGSLTGVWAAAKAVAAWAGAPLNTILPGGQKTYIYANDVTGLNRIGNPSPDLGHARELLRDPKVGLVSFVAVGHGGTITYFTQRR